jgi:hypothetical protein
MVTPQVILTFNWRYAPLKRSSKSFLLDKNFLSKFFIRAKGMEPAACVRQAAIYTNNGGEGNFWA